MRKAANILLMLFTIIISQSATANSISNSSKIKIQVIVTESMFSKNCSIDFDSASVKNRLLHTSNNNCQYNRAKLIKKASDIASTKLTKSNNEQFLTITITAP